MPLYSEQPTDTDLGAAPKADPTSPGAFSESFDIGYEVAADPLKSQHGGLPLDTYDLYGDNQWPEEDVLPGFREVYLRYFGEALALSRALIRIFALALDLPEDFFDTMVKNPGATSRMLHYPPQPVADEVRIGLGEHTVSRYLKDKGMRMLKREIPISRTMSASLFYHKIKFQLCRSSTLGRNGFWHRRYRAHWL